MKLFQNILVGVFALLNCVACSTATEKNTSVAQDRIHQFYSAAYDGRTDTTTASAQFRFGDGTGTTLELMTPARVIHNHLSLSKSSLLGTSYEGSGAGFIPDAEFIYTDANGTSYVNSARIVPIGFRNPPIVMRAAFDTSIYWSGGPLSEGEEVSLVFTSTRTGVSAGGSITTEVPGATSVVLGPSVFANSPMGTYQMCLTRSKGTTLQHAASVGGEFSVRYTTAYFSFTLTN